MTARRTLTAVAVIIAVPILFTYVWPASVGGRASYVVVSGISMEPTYHTGDLVIAQESSTYDTGDIVIYRTEQGDVIHRIVGGDPQNGYVIRGDNKTDVDPWRPTRANIKGKAWLAVPKLGGLVHDVRAAIPLPLVAGALVALFGFESDRRRRRRRPPAHSSSKPQENAMTSRTLKKPRRARQIASVGLAIAAAGTLLVAPPSWTAFRTAPTSTQTVRTGALTHDLTFAYTALAKDPSAVYPMGRVGPVVAAPIDEAARPADDTSEAVDTAERALTTDTGVAPPQALYRGLIDEVDVVVRYDHHGSDAEVHGTYQIELDVSTPDGWHASLPGGRGTTDFSDSIEVEIPVRFEAAHARMTEVAEATGIAPTDFTISVIPRIDVEAEVGGEPLATTISEPFDLSFDGRLIEPDQDLRVTKDSEANRTTLRSNVVSIVGHEVGVTRARTVLPFAIGGLVALAALCAYVGWGRNPAERIRVLHRSRLVDVDPNTTDTGLPIRVSSFNELRRLAQRDDRVILHQDFGSGDHRYFVPDGDITYEFLLLSDDGGRFGIGTTGAEPPTEARVHSDADQPSAQDTNDHPRVSSWIL